MMVSTITGKSHLAWYVTPRCITRRHVFSLHLGQDHREQHPLAEPRLGRAQGRVLAGSGGPERFDEDLTGPSLTFTLSPVVYLWNWNFRPNVSENKSHEKKRYKDYC